MKRHLQVIIIDALRASRPISDIDDDEYNFNADRQWKKDIVAIGKYLEFHTGEFDYGVFCMQCMYKIDLESKE